MTKSAATSADFMVPALRKTGVSIIMRQWAKAVCDAADEAHSEEAGAEVFKQLVLDASTAVAVLAAMSHPQSHQRMFTDVVELAKVMAQLLNKERAALENTRTKKD